MEEPQKDTPKCINIVSLCVSSCVWVCLQQSTAIVPVCPRVMAVDWAGAAGLRRVVGVPATCRGPRGGPLAVCVRVSVVRVCVRVFSGSVFVCCGCVVFVRVRVCV